MKFPNIYLRAWVWNLESAELFQAWLSSDRNKQDPPHALSGHKSCLGDLGDTRGMPSHRPFQTGDLSVLGFHPVLLLHQLNRFPFVQWDLHFFSFPLHPCPLVQLQNLIQRFRGMGWVHNRKFVLFMEKQPGTQLCMEYGAVCVPPPTCRTGLLWLDQQDPEGVKSHVPLHVLYKAFFGGGALPDDWRAREFFKKEKLKLVGIVHRLFTQGVFCSL